MLREATFTVLSFLANGIHRTPEVRPVAWFRDPAGNILSIIEE
jgi:hypothetical protein